MSENTPEEVTSEDLGRYILSKDDPVSKKLRGKFKQWNEDIAEHKAKK